MPRGRRGVLPSAIRTTVFVAVLLLPPVGGGSSAFAGPPEPVPVEAAPLRVGPAAHAVTSATPGQVSGAFYPDAHTPQEPVDSGLPWTWIAVALGSVFAAFLACAFLIFSFFREEESQHPTHAT